METKDLCIIGGGICGMTAAIYAARANIGVTIIEQAVCGGLVNSTHTVENFPSFKSIHGMELMAKCREQVEDLGVNILEVEDVQRVDFSGALKHVYSSEDAYSFKAVIVATGRAPIPLPLNTDFEHVHYCSVCDGTAYKDKDIVVVGGGNSGFDESLYLLGLGVKSIKIIEMFPQCIAAASTQAKALASGKIEVFTSTKLTEIVTLPSGRGLVHHEQVETGAKGTLEVGAVFCFIGQKPNTDVFAGILEMERGYIKTNVDMETNVQGVFAAGDVTVKKYRQITTAMGDGTIAALNAEKYIRFQV